MANSTSSNRCLSRELCFVLSTQAQSLAHPLLALREIRLTGILVQLLQCTFDATRTPVDGGELLCEGTTQDSIVCYMIEVLSHPADIELGAVLQLAILAAMS